MGDILIIRDRFKLVLAERPRDRMVTRQGGDRLVIRQGGARGPSAPTGIGFFVPGRPAAGGLLLEFPIIGTMTLSASRSAVTAASGATDEKAVILKVDGAEVGRATFPAGGQGDEATAELSLASDPLTLSDVRLRVYGPDAQDLTLSDLGFNLVSG